MATLATLAKKLRRNAKELPDRVNELAQEVASAMVKDLVNVTPVDTSKALSNWQVQIGSPITGHIPAHVLGKRGSTQTASASAAIAAALVGIRAKKPGEPLYISNATPYIKYLDEGSSSQFAGGFKERAVLVGRVALRGNRLLK